MKKNLLKTLLALALVLSLFALASCAEVSKVVDQIENTIQDAIENTENTENNENTESETEEGYAVTFVTDEHSGVTVYTTQDMTADGEGNATVAYSINKDTGKLTKSGEGQVNFVVVLEEGYELADIAIEGTYKNLKGEADTGVENGYRITKIESDLTVTVTTKEAEAAEDFSNGYQVTFVVDGNASVTVYKTQDLTADGEENATVAYSRDGATGALTKTDGQVNFVVVAEEGYEVVSVTATEGTYKNIKDQGNGAWRITKITGDTTVTITVAVAAQAAE